MSSKPVLELMLRPSVIQADGPKDTMHTNPTANILCQTPLWHHRRNLLHRLSSKCLLHLSFTDLATLKAILVPPTASLHCKDPRQHLRHFLVKPQPLCILNRHLLFAVSSKCLHSHNLHLRFSVDQRLPARLLARLLERRRQQCHMLEQSVHLPLLAARSGRKELPLQGP